MGYILPVDNIAYKDYHNRLSKKEEKYTTIDRTYKVLLESRKEIKDTFNYSTKGFQEKTKEKAVPTQKEMSKQVYVEITGKGGIFNEVV